MFGRKQKETWWENTGDERDAASETQPEKPKGKRKHRLDWWDAAGDLLEVVIDIVADLFD